MRIPRASDFRMSDTICLDPPEIVDDTLPRLLESEGHTIERMDYDCDMQEHQSRMLSRDASYRQLP